MRGDGWESCIHTKIVYHSKVERLKFAEARPNRIAHNCVLFGSFSGYHFYGMMGRLASYGLVYSLHVKFLFYENNHLQNVKWRINHYFWRIFKETEGNAIFLLFLQMEAMKSIISIRKQ